MGTKIGISKNTIGNYEKRVRTTKKNTIFDLAKVFSSLIDASFLQFKRILLAISNLSTTNGHHPDKVKS